MAEFRVRARLVIGVIVGAAAIGYSAIELGFFDNSASSETDAQLLADYTTSAHRQALRQQATQAKEFSGPAAANLITPVKTLEASGDTDETTPLSPEQLAKDIFCGSAETRLHPDWDTASIARYCSTHNDAPERVTQSSQESRDPVMEKCVAAWQHAYPEWSHDHTVEVCEIAMGERQDLRVRPYDGP